MDGIGQLHLYGLFLDYDEDSIVQVTNLSTATIGGRASGIIKAIPDLGVIYGAEYATQSDYGSNTQDYSAAYYQGELGASFMGVTLKYGYSVMEGDTVADHKFTTPLASLHPFDGWVDMFVNTPDLGLKAHQVTLSYVPPMLAGLTLTVVYYSFDAEANSDHFGEEWDVSVEYKVASFPGLMLGTKYAQFTGDDLAGIPQPHAGADEVSKFWLYTQYVF